MAGQVDRQLAALIFDLKRRGLLDETLIVSAGEFGGTSFSQGGDTRDHNPYGFSVWLAGAGVKGEGPSSAQPTNSVTTQSRTLAPSMTFGRRSCTNSG